jgi:hypothetical protein
VSADQLRRAAHEVNAGTWNQDVDVAIVAVLQAAIEYAEAPEWTPSLTALGRVLSAVDTLAAAYLGEEPQP